jgi:hypothetical protein
LIAAATTATAVSAAVSSYSLIGNLSKETEISVPYTLQAEENKGKLPTEYQGACDVNPDLPGC